MPILVKPTKLYPPAELVQPAKEPILFTGNNEYELLHNVNENGLIWKNTRDQLNKLIEWTNEN